MRICSHCRRSYSDRSRKCPTCGTYLLGLYSSPAKSRRPPSPPEDAATEGLVVICRCHSQWEADFVRALLDAEGIAAAQRPTPAVTSLAYLPPVASGIEILVRAEDEEDARDIILSGRQDMPVE